MKLSVTTETLAPNEDHSWLASVHGLDTTQGTPKNLDGTAWGAIYTDGFVKSGSVLALNTSTNKVVPFDNAGSNGTNASIGLLYTTIDIRNGSGGFADSPGSMLKQGAVKKSKLPRTNVQTGGPHANAISGLPLIDFRA